MRSLRLAQAASLHLARPPPNSDWCVGHDTRREPQVRAPPPKRMGERFPAPCKLASWRSCKQLVPTRALMLVSPAARPSINIISHSVTCKLIPRNSSTLYDALNPRLRPKHGELVKYSGRLRQQQTTRRRCQASRGKQPRPATRQLPRPGCATPLQCVLTDSDARWDIQQQSIVFLFTPPLCPSPCDYKRERMEPLQGSDLLQIEHHIKGLGLDTLSRPACNPYYKHS
jgi:hypothetical protein